MRIKTLVATLGLLALATPVLAQSTGASAGGAGAGTGVGSTGVGGTSPSTMGANGATTPTGMVQNPRPTNNATSAGTAGTDGGGSSAATGTVATQAGSGAR